MKLILITLLLSSCVTPKKPSFPATSNIADIPAHPSEEIYAPKDSK